MDCAAPLKLGAFDVSETRGFMPEEIPCKTLPDHFRLWEDIISDLPQLIERKEIRDRVEKLDQLEISEATLGKLETNRSQWLRAYVVATFIGQAYIWTNKDDTDVKTTVPKCIAVPWSEVAEKVELPPVVTYATACLYNWYLADPTKPTDEENLKSLITYTGLLDEEWFYIISLLVEVAAAPGIRAVVEAYNALASNSDATEDTLFQCMKRILESAKNMTAALDKMYSKCSPEKFYGDLRRFQRGSKSSQTPSGIIYEGVGVKNLSGASAGQSSTLPVFDIFLGVKHDEPEEGEKPGPVFEMLDDMRKHMPMKHQRFLEALKEQPKQPREYVKEKMKTKPEMAELFNSIVSEIFKFRGKHFALVRDYILQQMPPASGGEAEGTGGTPLKMFLKAVQKNTKKAKLPIS